ncbi:MAG: DUF5615 family PIN-like protein [Dehalococcoidia bacterium]
MRILANENIARETIEALRSLGHEVASTSEDASGATDIEVLARARHEDRIVLTFDQDFGELAFKIGLPLSAGVILLRLRASNAEVLTQIVVSAISGRDDWIGHFSVIESGRVRMTPLRGEPD